MSSFSGKHELMKNYQIKIKKLDGDFKYLSLILSTWGFFRFFFLNAGNFHVR